jgi:tRNA(Ile)-lysidine synthase
MSIDLQQIIIDFLRERNLWGRPSLVGFSGGADSCALLVALQQLDHPLTAVHFHHGLRGKKADQEAAWCREFCQQRGIPFRSQCLRVRQQKQASESIEEAARRLRLQALQKLSDDGHAPVFLAHHADDCLEDIFLRMARGANSSGLTGLRTVRRVGKVLLCRPLLKVRKADLENFLRSHGVAEWCLDNSNQDNRFRRNAVRNLLLPEFRRIFHTDSGLLQTRQTLLEDAEFLEELAQKQLPSLTSRAAWRNVPPALLPRVLRLWWRREFFQDIPPSASLCRRLQLALLKDNSSGEIIPAGRGRQLFLDKNGLRRWETRQGDPPSRQWDWRQSPCLTLPDENVFFLACAKGEKILPPGKVLAEECFDSAKMPLLLLIRFWRAGDSMTPFGGTFHKKLQDLFTEARIARDRRRHIPLLLAGSQIIWVPTVRRAEFARVTETKEKIKICFGFLQTENKNLEDDKPHNS